jgi:hypothetical protein
MEFKGTKAPWYINHTRSHICETKIVSGDIRIAEAKHYNDEVSDDWKDDPTFEEGRANALLISKAPELLEMLKDIEECRTNFDRWDEIKQLIKEATEF